MSDDGREHCGWMQRWHRASGEKFSAVKSHARDYDLGILVCGFTREYEGYTVTLQHGYLEFNVKFQITGYQRIVIGCTRCIIRNH